MPEPQDLSTEALRWHLRLRDGDGATWEAFAEWLAADPRHAAAYDMVETLDADLTPILAQVEQQAAVPPIAANDDDEVLAPRSRRGWWWGGGAALVAASAAALLVVAPMMQRPDLYEIRTAPGEHRIAVLDAGTRITLNGSSRIVLDRKDPRFARLEAGQALFEVRHDAKAPFTLTIGEDRVVDVGTVFDVVRDAGQVRVAVSEGEVLYNPDRQAMSLKPGQVLVDLAGSDTPTVTDLPRDAVGGWSRGQLIYTDEPLSRVAGDLGRSLGLPLATAPSVSARRFTGVLTPTKPGEAELRRLAQVLGVRVMRSGDGWIMSAQDDAHR